MPDELFFANDFSNFRESISLLVDNADLRKKMLAILTEKVEGQMLHSKIVEYIISSSLKPCGKTLK